MKPGPNLKQRSRGRNNNGGGKKHMPSRNQTYDSNGPDIRIRGNAHQVLEKYLTLARDATAQGDRIAAENYYQHAEHYFRVISSQNQANGRPNDRPIPSPADDQMILAGDLDGDEGEGEEEAAEATEHSAPEEAEAAPEAVEAVAEEPQPQRERPPRRRGPRGDRQPKQDQDQGEAAAEA